MAVRKSNKSYTVDVSLGTDKITGKRKRVVKKGIKTYGKAKEVEAQLLQTKNSNNLLFKELCRLYLCDSKEFDKISTYKKKKNLINSYLEEFWIKFTLLDITEYYVNEFQVWLNEHSISSNYKRSIFTLFNSIINFGIKYEYVNIKPFKQRCKFDKEQVEMKFWELEEFKKFISFVDNEVYNILFSLLFFTGIRKGEALALTWADINFDNQFIKVDKSCSYVSGEGYIISTPKTKSSYRNIYINRYLLEKLKSYKVYQSKTERNYIEESHLFSIENKILPKSQITRRFKKYIDKSGVKQIRIHDLRHSHVALLIHLNEDILTIKKRLGHSDASVTLNVYGHLYSGRDMELACKLDSLMNY